VYLHLDACALLKGVFVLCVSQCMCVTEAHVSAPRCMCANKGRVCVPRCMCVIEGRVSAPRCMCVTEGRVCALCVAMRVRD